MPYYQKKYIYSAYSMITSVSADHYNTTTLDGKQTGNDAVYPHTKSSLASSGQAVFGKHGNPMEWTHQQQAVEQAVAVHSSMQRLISFAPNSCSNCCCVYAARRTSVHTQKLDGEVQLWWTIMDVERLISEVFQCLAIWDSKERKHSDRLYIAKA